jgi:hypothetical protein
MAHSEQMQFVRNVSLTFPKYFSGVKVLEIGSLNINGTVRQFFNNCDYTGVDLAVGKDVDVVQFGHLLKYADGHFNTSISCECFEHDEHWAKTFSNMVRMTNGLVVMTCATIGRPEHGTFNIEPNASPFTNNYYKNLSMKDFYDTFDVDKLFTKHQFSINPTSADLYFWGLTNQTSG